MSPAHEKSPSPARILVVGDEVLGGEVTDANGPVLLKALAEAGVRVCELRILPDHATVLEQAVRESVTRQEQVVITGGIGPTHDDLTRPAVAAALNLPLSAHPELRARLAGLLGPGATSSELEMAHLPQGAELLLAGDGPGFAFRSGPVTVFPGVPVLLERILRAHPGLFTGRPWIRREVTTLLREGVLAAELTELDRAWPEVRWGSYPELTDAGWRLRLVLRAPDATLADRAEEALHDLLGRHNRG